MPNLEAHRKCQDEFRSQFGPDYRCDFDLIFANPKGSPLKPDSISATVSALCKRLKIPKPKGASLHLLRHTLASQMMDGGEPLPVVSQRLGHSSVRVTADIYLHAIHGQDDEAVRLGRSTRNGTGRLSRKIRRGTCSTFWRGFYPS